MGDVEYRDSIIYRNKKEDIGNKRYSLEKIKFKLTVPDRVFRQQ